MPPSWAANALLHPGRRPPPSEPAQPHESVDLVGDGVKLKGWIFRAPPTARRGTVVYLHGVGDNRGSSVGLAQHLTARGFDVVAYDSRAHGESGGEACTYGYYEKRDLARVLDQSGGGPFVLFGVSLGAAVALQTAADDPRVAAVVAVSTFSDLRTVAFERAPFFASRSNKEDALRIAEAEAKFDVAEVSSERAAPRIKCPVLLVHGAEDRETPPEHSERVFAALPGPKRLILVSHAGHANPLDGPTWKEIDRWLDDVVPAR
jgi:pimeloyl-ACP methyl ester carboxylesterase